MKKRIICFLMVLLSLFVPACNAKSDYVLTEKTFFLVMTNMQYYPQQYLGAQIDYDCFTYRLADVNGNEYICGVRKCSAGYGCTCGQDTIIGFILDYDKEIPEPVNQSEDSNDKTWVHISGKLKSSNFIEIEIHSYNEDGTVNPDVNEFVKLLEFEVDNLELIDDYSGLNYYVTK